MITIQYNTVFQFFVTSLLAGILLCANTTDILAQSKDDMRWRFGILGGINTTSIIGGTGGSFQKLGITAGVVLHKPLSERSAFEANLLFFQKGTRTAANPDVGVFEYRLTLNYLDLPILYIYKLKKFEVELGPSFGLLLSQNEKVFEGSPPDSRPFKTVEVAINTGLRWHPADNFVLGLRYHLAMLPSQSVAPAGLATMRGRHNHGFVLFGTFLF